METGIQLESVIFQGLSFKNVVIYTLFIILVSKHFRFHKIKPHIIVIKTYKLYIIIIILSVMSLLIPYFNANARFNYIDALISIKRVMLDGLLTYLIYFYFSLNTKSTEFMLKMLIVIIGISAFLTFVDAATNSINIFGFDLVETNRPLGAFGEPNQTALIIALYVPFIISTCLVGNFYKWISFSSATFCFAAIVMTSSRGGLISLCIGVLAFLWMSNDKLKIEQKFLMSITLPLSLLIAWYVLPVHYIDLIYERFSFLDAKKINMQEASAGRTYLWDIGYNMWIESPIFGNGWTAFKSTTGAAIHNTILEYMIGMGLVGSGVFIYLWYTIFTFIMNTKRFCSSSHETIIISSFSAGILALLTGLLFVNLYTTWLFVWIYVAITMAYCNNIRYKHRTRFFLASPK